MVDIRLVAADDESSRAGWREHLTWLAIGLTLGAVAVLSVLVPAVERLLNLAFAAVFVIGLGLLVVGWLIVQIVAEIDLWLCYDTPKQRAEALRQGELAWRARQAETASKPDEPVPTVRPHDNNRPGSVPAA